MCFICAWSSLPPLTARRLDFAPTFGHGAAAPAGEQDICSKQDEYEEALDIARRVAKAYEDKLGPVRRTCLHD